jgi:hypothetical protein
MGKKAVAVRHEMVSSDLTSTNDPQLVLIYSLINQLSVAIFDYLGSFTKETSGKRSTGDISLDFIKDCLQGVVEFPEILAQSFNKEDMSAKATAVLDFVAFQANITKAINDKWSTNAMICKTDAMSYALEYYSIVQREADKSVKYKPLYEKLKAYHKRSKADDTKTSGDTKPLSPTEK